MHSKICLHFIFSPPSCMESLGNGEERSSLTLKYIPIFQCSNLSGSGMAPGICVRILYFFFPWLPVEFISRN